MRVCGIHPVLKDISNINEMSFSEAFANPIFDKFAALRQSYLNRQIKGHLTIIIIESILYYYRIIL